MAKIEDINVKYTQMCTELGNVVFKIDLLTKGRDQLMKQIFRLEKEAQKLKGKNEKLKN